MMIWGMVILSIFAIVAMLGALGADKEWLAKKFTTVMETCVIGIILIIVLEWIVG
jgi:hypothetical protein